MLPTRAQPQPRHRARDRGMFLWTGWGSAMLGLCPRDIALAVMLVGLPTAQAADTTLTLACQGTTTAGTEEPEPVSMGIIVNFTKRTVQGFNDPSIVDYPVRITAWNDVTVDFGSEVLNSTWSTSGSIDRVTGDVEATLIVTDPKTSKTISSTVYALKCRPAQRMF